MAKVKLTFFLRKQLLIKTPLTMISIPMPNFLKSYNT